MTLAAYWPAVSGALYFLMPVYFGLLFSSPADTPCCRNSFVPFSDLCFRHTRLPYFFCTFSSVLPPPQRASILCFISVVLSKRRKGYRICTEENEGLFCTLYLSHNYKNKRSQEDRKKENVYYFVPYICRLFLSLKLLLNEFCTLYISHKFCFHIYFVLYIQAKFLNFFCIFDLYARTTYFYGLYI